MDLVTTFFTNFPQNMPMKKVENRPLFGDDMDRSLRFTFLATLYVYQQQ